ncbi:post-GPI attachment to proteins factor 6 [Denticeps clupeoides]|uniref:EGF-like domain-containing protein n=1 Tax=Denticeps clupeoides TaxID=299321 RepID=A0A8C3Z5E1_9TELE|nr:transmembrane protein 8B-like [Denticeps clupeoides]
MDARSLRLLVLSLAASACCGDDVTYVTSFYAKTAQRLSKYSSYASVRLHHFQVPEDAVAAAWLLTVTRSSGFNCGTRNVTVHFRAGAPPVINPLCTTFPNDTAVELAWNLTLSVSTWQNVTFFNVTNPAPGDWFVAAHLPEDDGKIEQKGLPSCSYMFQPQMLVRRVVDTPTLLPNGLLTQTLSPSANRSLLRVFVPEFSSQLTVFIPNCSVGGVAQNNCGLALRIGSSSLRQGSVMSYNCTGEGPCIASVSDPPWQTWVLVSVETSLQNVTVTFNVSAKCIVDCKPLSSPGDFSLNSSVTLFMGNTTATAAGNFSNSSDSGCVQSPVIYREDKDVLSLRFIFTNGNLTVSSYAPTLLTFDLNSASTSGGVLNVQVALNTTSSTGEFGGVRACLSPSSPVMQPNISQQCATAFAQGYSVGVNGSAAQNRLRIPFPQAAAWYLTLQTTCGSSAGCRNVSAVVSVSVSVGACVDDCGAYGDCRLLRTYSYLYGVCSCKAGWAGWGCTDGSDALSLPRQLMAVLFLTLSNLLFVPPTVLALYRGYLPEAAVYLYNMFFSTFYHACDQPGVTVLCIMDYDTLQFCDFLASCASVWVTVICMARLQEPFKYIFFMTGTLLIAMAMQLDRHGLWSFLGPLLFALITMAASWAYRGVKRRQCYPPLWRRWAFFLLPGVLLAAIGVGVYAFAETDANYLYTHSLWHVVMATCILFLLPPRARHAAPWGWTRHLCGYEACGNRKEELYSVG